MELLPGNPDQPGAHSNGEGVNFTLRSSGAETVELCLFDPNHREAARLAMHDSSAGVWHGYVPGCAVGQRYGYRVHGPYQPEEGLRFNSSKLLLDPYARQLDGVFRWGQPVYDFELDAAEGIWQANHEDSAAFVPKGVVTASSRRQQPEGCAVPWTETIIYECNVRGYTMRFPGLSKKERGTFAGMRNKDVLAYLVSLGVSSVELQPVQAFIDEAFLVSKGLRNYWGYNTLAFFAPENRYAGPDPLTEFREMVDAIHDAGLEVLLDIAFNHTAEGSGRGPTLSCRGIDNLAWYRTEPGDRGAYVNDTGCGNTLNADSPQVQDLVIDALAYWSGDMGVDGFRFDLATILGRHPNGFSSTHPLLQRIGNEPRLKGLKLVAEPWDPGPGGYQLGNFPPGWAEWNDCFRDSARRSWRGEAGQLPELARRLHGSSDVFETDGRKPWASINFVTSHDGFTLADLVSYRHKHNEPNGESNRDGHDHNFSSNHGVEGASDEPVILAARRQHRLNLLATLLLSQGTPMLLAGDEFGHSQQGNNNAYAQDNETGWLGWSSDPAAPEKDPGFTATVRALIELRRNLPLLRQDSFVHDEDGTASRIRWMHPDGSSLQGADWDHARALMLVMREADQSLALLLNTAQQSIEFCAPKGDWHMAFASPANPPSIEHGCMLLPGNSLVCLIHPRPIGQARDTGGKVDSFIVRAGRKAGVVMHISSLPGEHGIGDIADSSMWFIDRLAEMKLGVWQFLPLGPTAYGDSPYQPLSAFAGNPNLVGLEPLLQLGLLSKAELQVLRDLPADFTDYGRLIPAKSELLKLASSRFTEKQGAGLLAEYEQFLHEHSSLWLDDYALFRALKTAHGERPWPEWDKAYVHRNPGALHQARIQFKAEIEQTRVTQFLFDRQWQAVKAYATEKGISLFGDMPIYIALDSADAWAHPELLQLGRDGRPSHVAGVPPDYFSEEGQLWGNPLYDWAHHERTGYQWWIDRIRHASRQSHLVRIDHFRGFESFWSVPFGERTAENGEWLPGPGNALFEALKKSFDPLPIVAEDLGVITSEVDELRERHGLPGMVVLQFKVDDPDFAMDQVQENSVCYTGTHDNDTTLGWFQGSSDEPRSKDEIEKTRSNALALTGGNADSIHWDMLRLAFSSQSAIAMAPMQDYLGLGSMARINKPGTTGNNWRWRMQADALTAELMESVASLVLATSRNP